jgi:hypothetical protein
MTLSLARYTIHGPILRSLGQVSLAECLDASMPAQGVSNDREYLNLVKV